MFTLNCTGKLLVLDKPAVMGVINITPDSFYSQSRMQNEESVLEQVGKMLDEGAMFLDIGGQSTRPGSTRITAAEEAERILPVVEVIIKHYPQALVSVDTYQSKVAGHAVNAGASVINDISAGSFDEEMLPLVGKLRVPYICMHIKGTPETMQQNPQYENVTREVLDYFIKKMEDCRKNGIHDVMIDPGFGFGKTSQHNFQLLGDLSVFKILERPLVAGLSRKATIYKTLNTTAEHALNGTTVLNTLALLNGAAILRVHDVREAVECISLVQAYQAANS